MLFKKNHDRWLKHIISAPFIYGVFIGFIVFDLFLEIYHQVCFPLYGLKKISRKEYIVIDRHKLSYLRTKEKLNCVYCGYANGLASYATKIIGETERYWCGIKHKKPSHQAHHKDFIDYGDEKAFKKKYL